MSFDYSRVVEITSLGVSASPNVLVTNASGYKTYIRSIILHNTYSSDVIVWLFNVPNGSGVIGTPSIYNQFIRTTLAAYATSILEIPIPGIILADSFDSIQGYASLNNTVTVQMYGGIE